MRNAPPLDLPAVLRRSAVLQAVRAAWQELAANTPLIKEGSPRVLIACSGGPDSTALLLALWALREPLRLQLRVACVDHQLRRESADEAAAVCQLAQRLGLEAERISVEVPSGPSRAARARQVRYEALGQAAVRSGCGLLAVGHNRDDQSETMLMRWLAGSGLRGLVGMSACRRLRPDDPSLLLVRPLLSVPRCEIDTLLALAREHVRPLPFQDPSNESPRYQRSRLRHHLLPLLRREQPRLDAHLSELSEQLRADAECLDELAEAALRRLAPREPVQVPGGGALLTNLPVPELVALPRALFARVVMRAAGGGLGQAHLDALWRLCQSTHGSQSLELPQRRAERRYDRLLLSRRSAAPPQTNGDELLLHGAGELALPEFGLRLRLRECPRGELPTAAPWRIIHPSELPLCVRPARRGERIELGPTGHRPGSNPGSNHGSKKLSDVLVDHKVPRSERPHARVLSSGDRILWLLVAQGLVRAAWSPHARAPVGAAAEPLLVVELLRP